MPRRGAGVDNEPTKLRTVVIMDYQNVHLTARDRFDPDAAPEDCLIHPVQFANTLLRTRNNAQAEGYPHAKLRSVIAFRGLPSPDHEPEMNRFCIDQKRQWARDHASVHLRPLKYRYEHDASGKPIMDIHGKKQPKGRPEEKGVDVMVALECLTQALNSEVDLVILASHDTDLAPVLDRVLHLRDIKGVDEVAAIETFSWYSKELQQENKFPGSQIRPGNKRRIWNTRMDRAEYEASRDYTVYQ